MSPERINKIIKLRLIILCLLKGLIILCPMCHSVKTKKFKNNRNFFTSTELANGAGMMEVDKVVKKKRKN
jgi:hypothetical protein